VLAKETMLILVAGYVLYMFAQRRFGHGLLMGACVAGPFALWQLCLFLWLGSLGIGAGGAGSTPFHLIPFGALLSTVRSGWMVFLSLSLVLIPAIVIPTVWAVLAAGQAIARGECHPWAFALLLYAGCIPFLPASTFLDLSAMPRFVSPLVVLTILFAARGGLRRVLNGSVLWVATVLLVLPFG
jgi:hypothetical protein